MAIDIKGIRYAHCRYIGLFYSIVMQRKRLPRTAD